MKALLLTTIGLILSAPTIHAAPLNRDILVKTEWCYYYLDGGEAKVFYKMKFTARGAMQFIRGEQITNGTWKALGADKLKIDYPASQSHGYSYPKGVLDVYMETEDPNLLSLDLTQGENSISLSRCQ